MQKFLFGDERLGWGNILVALPLAHVLIASLVLYGYALGFGGHLSQFLKPEDLFATTLSEVMLIYVVFVVEGAVLWWFVTAGFDRTRPRKYGPFKPHAVPLWQHIAVWVAVAFTSTWLLGSYLLGGKLVASAFPLMAVLLLSHYGPTLGARLSGSRRFIPITAIGLLIPLAFGADQGQRDRHLRLGGREAHRPTCGGKLVLRAVGENYLAFSQGRHGLIDGECKTVFTIPAIDPEIDRSTLPQWARRYLVPVLLHHDHRYRAERRAVAGE
jgi:hypothetical protein